MAESQVIRIERKLDLIVRLLREPHDQSHSDIDARVLSRIEAATVGKTRLYDHAKTCDVTVPQFRDAIYRLADRGKIIYSVDPGKRRAPHWVVRKE